MDVKVLQEQVRKAAEIAKAVPENLQEAAFHRAFDFLSGATQRGSGNVPSAGPVSLGLNPPALPKHPVPEKHLAELLIDRMNAAEHPKIRTTTTVLDRSLAVLHAARSAHQVDGLTPSEIAQVLTEKFRISTRSATVSDALGKVTGEFVDRSKEGSGYRYCIMEAGERHLELDETPVSTLLTSKPQPAGREKATKKSRGPGKANLEAGVSKPAEKATRKSSGRPGPKKIVSELIDRGFFNEPKGISDIINHLQDARGHTYKPTDLSPALVRLLRDERLKRGRNADGNYEYVAK